MQTEKSRLSGFWNVCIEKLEGIVYNSILLLKKPGTNNGLVTLNLKTGEKLARVQVGNASVNSQRNIVAWCIPNFEHFLFLFHRNVYYHCHRVRSDFFPSRGSRIMGEEENMHLAKQSQVKRSNNPNTEKKAAGEDDISREVLKSQPSKTAQTSY